MKLMILSIGPAIMAFLICAWLLPNGEPSTLVCLFGFVGVVLSLSAACYTGRKFDDAWNLEGPWPNSHAETMVRQVALSILASVFGGVSAAFIWRSM